MAQLAAYSIGGRGTRRLGKVGGPIVTLRATAWLRLPNGQLSDVDRTVSAMIKQKVDDDSKPPYHILRWYDNAPILQ